MLLQLATEQDFSWISAIQGESNLPLWKPNSTSWVLEKKAFAIWQVVGCECELLSIATLPSERGKGLAKMLMEHCHKTLAEQGIEDFFLDVRESNIAAISLYEKFGYKKISERKNYYSNGENAIVMKRM